MVVCLTNLNKEQQSKTKTSRDTSDKVETHQGNKRPFLSHQMKNINSSVLNPFGLEMVYFASLLCQAKYVTSYCSARNKCASVINCCL